MIGVRNAKLKSIVTGRLLYLALKCGDIYLPE